MRDFTVTYSVRDQVKVEIIEASTASHAVRKVMNRLSRLERIFFEFIRVTM